MIVDPDCDYVGDLLVRNEHIVQDEVKNSFTLSGPKITFNHQSNTIKIIIY